MALNLGSLTKSRQSSSGGGRGTENVAVMVAEVHIHDKTKKTANPTEDYAICYLLEDAFGKKAEFNDKVAPDHPEYMTPLTSVKVKMRDDVKVSGEFSQPGIYDLQVGKRKGASMPMGQFPIIVLESAYLDSRTDTVMARWYRVGQRDVNNTTERCLNGVLVSVDRESYEMRDNERNYYQNRYVMMPDAARTFSSMEEFKEIVSQFLTENPDAAGGRPAAMIRIIDPKAVAEGRVDETAIATTHVYPGWIKDEQRRLSPEESAERWLSDPENANWVEYISALEAGSEEVKGLIFELIPSYKYSTGRDSLPSKKARGKDDAEFFRIPAEDRKTGAFIPKNNGDGFVMTSGFAQGSMIVKRVNDVDAPWFATNTFRKHRFGPIFMRHEVVTPNLPEDVSKVLESRAEARGNAARQDWVNSRQAESASATEDEIHFAEPDHSGGLTPS